jgi:hypothetical protein
MVKKRGKGQRDNPYGGFLSFRQNAEQILHQAKHSSVKHSAKEIASLTFEK